MNHYCESGKVVAGGASGQESIHNGLLAAKEAYGEECNVLIHDGVRPLISLQTITDNIEALKLNGSRITCVPATETLIVNNVGNNPENNVENNKNGDREEVSCMEIPSRHNSVIARAPQSFRLRNILAAHERAKSEGRKDSIDSCSMMHHYGYPIHIISGPMENIKITTPIDIHIFKAILEMRENSNINDKLQ